MIRLITDTSCLYSKDEAEKLGFDINPLLVTINNKEYLEFTDIQADEFLNLINQGHIPTSSQPSIGSLLETINKYPEDEIIILCIADGLSGTYQSALSARQEAANPDKVHVINTMTLCGPQRYLVEHVLEKIKNNIDITSILTYIEEKIKTVESFLLPMDFDYLKRGGRLTPLASVLSGLLKLQPVIKQTKDGKRLDKFAIGRNFKIAISKIINHYKESLNDTYKLYISHAFNLEQALQIKKMFLDSFPNLEIELLELSCAFITQGGPKCIAIQSIEK